MAGGPRTSSLRRNRPRARGSSSRSAIRPEPGLAAPVQSTPPSLGNGGRRWPRRGRAQDLSSELHLRQRTRGVDVHAPGVKALAARRDRPGARSARSHLGRGIVAAEYFAKRSASRRRRTTLSRELGAPTRFDWKRLYTTIEQRVGKRRKLLHVRSRSRGQEPASRTRINESAPLKTTSGDCSRVAKRRLRKHRRQSDTFRMQLVLERTRSAERPDRTQEEERPKRRALRYGLPVGI